MGIGSKAWMVCTLAAGMAVPAAAQADWIYDAGDSQSWVAKNVSLGNRGTQVFAELGPAYPTILLSAFDADTAAPVWQSPADLAFNHDVAAAETTDLHVSLRHERNATIPSLRNGWLRVFTSDSKEPLWTARVSTWIANHNLSDVFVTPDGSTIVTAVFDTGTFKLDLEFYRPDSNLPFKTLELDVGGSSNTMLMSDDAQTFYVGTLSSGKVFELETGRVLTTQFVQTQYYGGHGLSGDGSVFAMGGLGNVRVFRRQDDNSYRLDFTHNVSFNGYCDRIAISSDGSTMAAGFNVLDGFRTTVVQAVDLKTGALRMSESIVGNGQLQNTITDLDITSDGQRIAATVSGDGAGVRELRIYDADRSIPIRTEDLPGSGLAVDISADGARVAVGCKGVHTTQAGSGGCIKFLQLDEADLLVKGVPVTGGSIDVEVQADQASTVVLFTADAIVDQPLFYPDLGLLYLRRAVTSKTTLGPTDANGFLRANISLARSAPGTTISMQGFLLPQQELTKDWVKVTVLPQ